MRFSTFAICATLILPQAVTAQEKTMLVLDASGSMWGQIEGVAKITIAQDAVGDLMKTVPEGQEIGLSAYGHNHKGDCSDIETLVEPGSDTRGAIVDAVNALKPKGKTPLSEAVRRAAEALRFEEDKATVILISDGVETCEIDPCAIGATLEETGVDFTAHVLGFDVSDEQAAGLKCLAKNTGGLYLAAGNASELSAALQKVSPKEPEPPQPNPEVSLEAPSSAQQGEMIQIGWTGPNADRDYISIAKIGDKASKYITYSYTKNGSTLPLIAPGEIGQYEVRYVLAKNNGGADDVVIAKQMLNVTESSAMLEAPTEAQSGTKVLINWTGPDADRDYISIAKVGEKPSRYVSYGYTKGGSPLAITVPGKAGQYEIRYVLAVNSGGSDDVVIAKTMLNVTESSATLEAPTEAQSGAEILVHWTGPNADRDYISIARISDKPSGYITYGYTQKGSPLSLKAPVEAGQYEIRYVLAVNSGGRDDVVIARKAIEVR